MKTNKIDAYGIRIAALSEEEGGGYLATFPQLGRMITGLGETRDEALKDLLGSVPALLDSVAEHKEALPESEQSPDWQDFSGRVTLRLPKMLHAQLDRLAEREGVSLNALLTASLQSAATAMAAGLEFGATSSPKRSYRTHAEDSARIVAERSTSAAGLTQPQRGERK